MSDGIPKIITMQSESITRESMLMKLIGLWIIQIRLSLEPVRPG